MSAAAAATSFVRIRAAVSADRAERVGAEAFAAGASGIEERDGASGIELLVYAPAACADAVHAAVRDAAGAGASVAREPVVERDWPETWKEGLVAVAVSPRLVVRPTFAAAVLADGQVEVVIEPRQAFGTGAHGSTALALAALDARLAAAPGARVLDVGAGSGVLAIAALRLGAAAALACDLDPIAARETRENATRNGVDVASFAGSVDALGPRAGRFDVVVANLISSELRPILAALAARVAPGGALVLSGLLAAEEGAIEALLAAHGLRVADRRCERDARGDEWLALTATR
jgi:ribosomal protein L11 methyltransferase